MKMYFTALLDVNNGTSAFYYFSSTGLSGHVTQVTHISIILQWTNKRCLIDSVFPYSRRSWLVDTMIPKCPSPMCPTVLHPVCLTVGTRVACHHIKGV